jgi:hypothetical protein
MEKQEMSCIAELEIVRLRAKVFNNNDSRWDGKSRLVYLEVSSNGQREKKPHLFYSMTLEFSSKETKCHYRPNKNTINLNCTLNVLRYC